MSYSSFIFGGGNRSIFDCVNLVTRSMAIDRPVVAININYRVGFGGFLASQDILEDMKKDGLPGVGNWALTDQQTALDWVQRYIPSFGGDKDNVTIYGLSAGGISVGHQLQAKRPPVCHRAISMSGVASTIPVMSLENHEKVYQKMLKHFNIEGPGALEKLRAVPQLDIADVTELIYGSTVTVSSPCDDGVFHETCPGWNTHISPPSWLKSYMVGDVAEEAEIFLDVLPDDRNYHWMKNSFARFMPLEDVEIIFHLYGLRADADKAALEKFFKDITADVIFGIPQREDLKASKIPESYGYHFDVVCFVHVVTLQAWS